MNSFINLLNFRILNRFNLKFPKLFDKFINCFRNQFFSFIWLLLICNLLFTFKWIPITLLLFIFRALFTFIIICLFAFLNILIYALNQFFILTFSNFLILICKRAIILNFISNLLNSFIVKLLNL